MQTTVEENKGLVLDGTKLAWHRERIEAWLRGERIAPITIDCALTRRCTYRCVYCIGALQANDEKKMTWNVIRRFLDDCAEIGVKAISFVSDGESTCSPHLCDAILHGKANGLDMALGTNGYLLQDDRLAEILPALTYLRFNFSAGQADSYAEIMGTTVKAYHKVVETIRRCVQIKRKQNLDVTLGLQMVLLPQYADQVMPLVELGKELGVDYLVIKHCGDTVDGDLGVEYEKYFDLVELLKEAEARSDENYLVKAKWSKILSGGKRAYAQCYGPPFLMQLSGSGLVAPCGSLFVPEQKEFHIGNITEISFKQMWQGERYWQAIERLTSRQFDARTMCNSLCLQEKINEVLWDIKHQGRELPAAAARPPMHINFI